jgi:hypothetical protein
MEKTLSQIATDLTNAYWNMGQAEFLKQMRELHRSNQQIFAGLVFTWLNDYVNYPTDERNERSVEYARELRNLISEATGQGEFKDRFPCI